MSIRDPETVDDNWKRIFRWEFGTITLLGAIVSFILLVVYLDHSGGWSPRGPTLTREYFDWHPLLMGISFLLLMTPAILSFEVFPFARHTNKNIHGYLNSLGFIAAICGLAIILDCHQNLSNKGSFHTLHSYVGISTLIFYFINLTIAFILYVLGIGDTLRATLKPLHKRLGLLTVMCGYATICVGLMEDSATKQKDLQKYTFAIGIGVYLTMAGIIFSVCKFMDKKDEYISIGVKEQPTPGGHDDEENSLL